MLSHENEKLTKVFRGFVSGSAQMQLAYTRIASSVEVVAECEVGWLNLGLLRVRGLREPNELQRAFGRAGITPDNTAIVYEEKLIAAARVWWALKYAGVDDARLMDGGFQAWVRAGYPVEMDVQLPQMVEFRAPVAFHLLATTDYIREHLAGSRVWLADVWSIEEFAGQKSGYSYIEAKGRIPSSTHVGDGDD
jgi:3-mercaptopyruvate sulfurtransferase SseA